MLDRHEVLDKINASKISIIDQMIDRFEGKFNLDEWREELSDYFSQQLSPLGPKRLNISLFFASKRLIFHNLNVNTQNVNNDLLIVDFC